MAYGKLFINPVTLCKVNRLTLILNKIPTRPAMIWALFSSEKFKSAITKYNNLSTPSLDKMSWKYLKVIIKDDIYLKNFINIINVCINLQYELLHFKLSLSIIIPKPNKT